MRAIITSNGVPYRQIRSVESDSPIGMGKEGKEERKERIKGGVGTDKSVDLRVKTNLYEHLAIRASAN